LVNQFSTFLSRELHIKGHGLISVNSIETDISVVSAESRYMLPEADPETGWKIMKSL